MGHWLLLLLCLLIYMVPQARPFSLDDIKGKIKNDGKRLAVEAFSLSGSIPPALGTLTDLTYIDLGLNDLVGPIPATLGSLINLRYLDLSNNKLSGPIPKELGNLSKLVTLSLQKNTLSGFIPSELGKLEKLDTLDLSENSLTGPLPVELTNLRNLAFRQISVSFNNLSGQIPYQFLFLRFHISFYKTSLYMSIPAEVETLSNVTLLWGARDLTGPIPPQIGKMTNLTYLELSYNDLSGSVPVEVGNLSRLKYLFLNGNHLTGVIPEEVGNLTNLRQLNFGENNFSGPVPDKLGGLAQLELLDLHENNLSGLIPPQLGNLGHLQGLDFGSNELSGPIPREFGNFVNVTEVYLDSNNLTSHIPPEIGKLQNLVVLNLSNNNFSGPVPMELANLSNLRSLYLDRNVYLDNIPMDFLKSKVQSLGLVMPMPPWAKAMKNVTFLRLSSAKQESMQLDLTSTPSSCQFIEWIGNAISDIRFPDACLVGTGCFINLLGTGSKLSFKTKKEICLGKISVLLAAGTPPTVETEVYTTANGTGIVSTYYKLDDDTKVYLNDSSFLDYLDFGTGSIMYTGVGSRSVPSRNKCGNPGAPKVFFAILGVFIGSIVITSVGVPCARGFFGGTNPSVGLFAHVRSVWAIVGSIVPIVDLATDIGVLISVWEAWPMWFVLSSILAPFMVAGFGVVQHIVSSMGKGLLWSPGHIRVRWLWPLPDEASLIPVSETRAGGPSAVGVAIAIMLAPLGTLIVLLKDVCALLNQLGFHVVVEERTLGMQFYHEYRVMLELVLESIPQAIFQVALYTLGSSRVTGIYIDEQIFVRSIGFSLLSILFQYGYTLWEAYENNIGIFATFIIRFRSGGVTCRVR